MVCAFREQFQRVFVVRQLLPHVAGKEIVSGTVGVCTVRGAVEVQIDHAAKFICKFFFGLAGERGHILHIHAGFLRNGERQSFRSGVHGGHGLMRFDRALRKHIRFALEVVVFIKDFQRAQQIIGAVIGKRQTVGTGVNETILFRKGIIETVQLSLCLPDGFIGYKPVHLLTNELLYTVAEFYHAFHTLLRGCVQFRTHHAGVLAVIYFAVYHGIGVIADIGVCRNRGVDFFAFTEFGKFGFLIGAADILDRIGKLIFQFKSFDGFHSEVLFSVLRAFRGLSAEDHFGMLHEIAVDGKSVIVFSEVNPVFINGDRMIALLKEDNIADNIGSGVCPESVVR